MKDLRWIGDIVGLNSEDFWKIHIYLVLDNIYTSSPLYGLFIRFMPSSTNHWFKGSGLYIHPQSEDHHSLSGIPISSLSSPTTFLNDSCRISTYVESSLSSATTLFFQTTNVRHDSDQHPLMTSKWPFVDKHFLFFQWNAFNVYIDRCIFRKAILAHTPSTPWTPSFQEHFRYNQKPKTWKKPMG